MSNGGSGTRPGGLTALAVLNFVFGGIKAILTLLAIGFIFDADRRSGGEVGRALAEQNQALLWIGALLSISTTLLLIVSGVGYLKQKRFMGRTLGNLYAVFSLADSGLSLANNANLMWTLIFAIYPLLTLMLLNTTFKEDRTN
jgi:hypothetical protein